MLTYTFQDLGSDTLYVHLYKCIKNDIINGSLEWGTKMPSKRSFAKNMGVSVITVENAYNQLMDEGYLYSIPKKGFYVEKIEHSIGEGILTTDNIKISKGGTSYTVDFSDNRTNSDNFPFTIWSKLVREILNDKQQELLTNPPCGGLKELRVAIANHLKEFRNMVVSPEQIIVGAGTEYLYGLLIQLLGGDKIFAFENPGYKKLEQIYASNHTKYTYINVKDDGIQLEELEKKKPDIVHLSPAHHFPTGQVMPVSKRYELLAWASKNQNRYIIEDEYDSEFRYIGKPIPTMQSIDVMEKVIYMNTFTKTLASTVRISYMVLPPHLINEYYEKLSFYSCTVSNFEQYILERFISQGYFEKHLNRMVTYYRKKRDLLLEEIYNSPLSKYATVLEENAGLHFVLKLKTMVSDDEIRKRAAQQGIRMVPLSFYNLEKKEENEGSEHKFIMNYSNLDEDKMKLAVQGIYKCL